MLYSFGVLDRFRPKTDTGSAPYHYILGHAGYIVTATNPRVTKFVWSPKKAHAIRTSPNLKHRVGANEFFCRLKAFERRNPDHRLTEWWSERETAKGCGGLVFPDGFGVWETPNGKTSFFLEYDRGTESLDRLRKKLKEYDKLLSIAGRHHVPVFVFEFFRREVSARVELKQHSTTSFATTTLEGDTKPHEAIWWQPRLTEHVGQLRLSELEC